MMSTLNLDPPSTPRWHEMHASPRMIDFQVAEA